jgi:hypothetical protein
LHKPIGINLLLIVIAAKEHAIKMKTYFDIPEKRYWRIKINALAHLGDWKSLYEFMNKKKESPVGYEPFIEGK